MKPITPNEAKKRVKSNIPGDVIAAFNELISENFRNGSARFTQTKVVIRIKEKMPDVTFDNRWLDVEPLFEHAGWIVKYDKPGYNEPGDATFEFKEQL